MEPTSNQLLEIPLTTRTLTQNKLSKEKRCSTEAALSPNENDERARVRKIASGASPPSHPPAAQRWSASPNRPSGCTLAAAAWLIQASETRRTTLSSQRTRTSARRTSSFPRPDAANANVTKIRPRRSCQPRPNSVSNKTVRQVIVEKTLVSNDPLMLAISSQNQSRAERSAATRLQTARRNKRCSTSRRSPLAGRAPVRPSGTSSKVKIPASRIDAAICT